MKLKNVNAKMTSFIIQNVIELLSIQLHSYVMLWCYSWKEWILADVFFVPTLVVECICVLIRWYASSLQNQRMIQRIRIRFNPSEIWMSHRRTNSNILFSVFLFTRNTCKTPCKNECENRMLWEQRADRNTLPTESREWNTVKRERKYSSVQMWEIGIHIRANTWLIILLIMLQWGCLLSTSSFAWKMRDNARIEIRNKMYSMVGCHVLYTVFTVTVRSFALPEFVPFMHLCLSLYPPRIDALLVFLSFLLCAPEKERMSEWEH